MPKKDASRADRERAIGKRVSEFRRYLKWSQPGFAQYLGMTRNQLASIEHGRTPLRYVFAYKLFTVFDVNQEWLLTGFGLMTGYTGKGMLPNPAERKPLILFSEVMIGDIAMASSELAALESGRIRKGETIKALQGDAADPNFDWCAAVFKKAVDICDRKHFKSESEKQSLAQRAFLALERFENESKRRPIISIFQANTAASSFSLDVAKNPIDDISVSGKHEVVKPQLPGLLERLNKATKERGMKSALAKFMGVPLANVSQWLSGTREPGGENTLKLLRWVEQQERQ